MNSGTSLIFAQITDIHVGSETLSPVESAHNLRWALQEIGELQPQPACIVATGDLLDHGSEADLEEFTRLAADSRVPIYALPANHDLWGEETTEPYERLVGPLRQTVDLPGLRIVMLDDIVKREENEAWGVWGAWVSAEKLAWVDEQLASAPGAKVAAQHAPILPVGDNFHDAWADSNAPELIKLYQQHNLLALITGHWHRNSEWWVEGVHVINTGGLCGWQYNGMPPYLGFPVLPGYRLLAYDGQVLHSFWRDGSYWTGPAPLLGPQVTLEWIGPAHTGGPRPQVRPAEVYANCPLIAKAYSSREEVTEVRWSVIRGQWEPMARTYNGLWSEWEVELDLQQLRAMGEQMLCVRALTSSGGIAYDVVPVRLAERECSAMRDAVASSLSERLFAPFYKPE